MAFTMNPDEGLPRLFRYVRRGTLPGLGLRALYDAKMNLLIIDKDWFDELTPTQKHLVLRTTQPYIDTESRLAA